MAKKKEFIQVENPVIPPSHTEYKEVKPVEDIYPLPGKVSVSDDGKRLLVTTVNDVKISFDLIKVQTVALANQALSILFGD